MTMYNEDIATIYYSYLISIFAIEKSVPIRALLLKNPRSDTVIIFRKKKNGGAIKTRTVIIFRKKKNGGAIKTRRFTMDKSERIFFLNSIAHDFPKLPLEILESEKA